MVVRSLNTAILGLAALLSSAISAEGAPTPTPNTAPSPASGESPESIANRVTTSDSKKSEPKIKDWIRSYIKTSRQQNTSTSPVSGSRPRFVRRVVFATDLGEQTGVQPQLTAIDPRRFNRLSYLETLRAEDLSWDIRINPRKMTTSADVAPAAPTPAQNLFRVGEIDSVVVTSEKGPWYIAQTTPAGNVEQVVTIDAPKEELESAEDFHTWLYSSFNYDGVILDRRGDLLLVGSQSVHLKSRGTQALAIRGTHDRIFIDRKDRDGAGLLSLVESDGDYGVFEVIFTEKSTREIPIGTKVLIERSKVDTTTD